MTEGRKVVVLDPGHGGRDPGALGPTGLREADVTLQLASLVKGQLERRGISVVMTRTADTDTSLARRCDVANRTSAAASVSLHCNAATNPEACGTETYHLGASAAGRNLAVRIHRGLLSLGLRDRGVRTAGYYVLRHTRMPAVLVELAFISNPREEQLLRDTRFLAAAACRIATGIEEYLGSSGGNKGGGT